MANIFATGDLAIEVDPYGNGGGRAVEGREREREMYTFFFWIQDINSTLT